MAYSFSLWEEAREYYEAGLSLSEIEKKTGISRPQICKKAKADLWQKGNEKKQLIDQAVEVSIKKETLKETALKVHNEIVDEKTKHLLFLHKCTIANVKSMMMKVGEDAEIIDHKHVQETIDKAGQTLGVVPRAGASVNIQNTNAQQTVINKIEREIIDA